MDSHPSSEANRRGGWRTFVGRALRTAATLVALSLFYGWAIPWAYPDDHACGMGRGVLHGALMPMALPTLLLGRDAPIFAINNTGRPYKIGYILGINACGFLVFGAMFASSSSGPTRPPAAGDLTPK